jgi:adenosylcobalamin-dependent ribonucleoside-diphosphate reductase
MAPEQAGIGIRRHFTTPGVHPYDEVTWERRDARITHYRDGAVAFEQLGVEVPATWSVNATNILAQKYFRGTLGHEGRESSLRQVADRVVDTITRWGVEGGYFTDAGEVEAFNAELKHLVVTQKAAFNSPVWFNIGVAGVPQQGSACQPYGALVSTPDGLVPIGRLVEADAVGTKVHDACGVTQVLATKANGTKPVIRLHTKAGYTLDATPDHLVWRASSATSGSFVEAGTLRSGDQVCWHRSSSWGHGELDRRHISEAALAGWLQSDGFVGQYAHGTNRSLTLEFPTVTEAEHEWIMGHLDVVFPDVHRSVVGVGAPDGSAVRSITLVDPDLVGRRIRLYGEVLRPFVERWGLLARGVDMRVPEQLLKAPLPVVAAYLQSMFQADGYVSVGEHAAAVGLDLVGEDHIRDLQRLLVRFGIFSRIRPNHDRRPDRLGMWSLTIKPLPERDRFAAEIGFVDPGKAGRLEASLDLAGIRSAESKRLEIDRVEALGEMEVYDIQTESGEYLSGGLRVHNCFILSVEDTMDSILNWYREEGTIFKGGSGAGVNLSRIRSSKEHLQGGGTASGPVSFMRGADASAGTIKSGGKTRRAAKMVILDVDHPDVEEFIWCKAKEEQKARVLRDAGFDMDLDGADSHSIQYQNANNSVRVTDEFMQAVEDDDDWNLIAVTTGEVVRTVRARDLFRQFAQATWECADPGMQFDTTINRWHTAANTGRINGSNPCSEYMHLDDSACNLASLNLLQFLGTNATGGEEAAGFDVEGFMHAVEVVFTAQEIIVGNADYPTERIAETTRRFRQLGIGYANLGALLMALGLPYDSDAGRAWAGAITALMTGHSYETSGRIASRMGPFAGYSENREPTLRVLDMHRQAAASIDEELVPAGLLAAAQRSWDIACEIAEQFGVRNSQASVLAPTGTIGLLMDCDTTGIEPDLGLVKMKKLVGGGTMSIVNQTIPRALRRLGYTTAQIEVIVAHIDEHKTIMGAPELDPGHVAVFACSMGDNTIHHSGHIRMMGAVQPFLSGAISKTVNLPEDATVADIEQLHIDAWKLGLKAVAVYRDNCKVAQPLSTMKKEIKEEVAAELAAAGAPAALAPQVVERIVEKVITVKEPVRQKLPRNRTSHTFEFRVADCKGFVTVGEYDDGRPGEVFLRVSKQGSTLAGVMDAFAISISYGLQYGVPLRAYVETFTNMRFEPAGMTDDPEIRFATSILDYIFRRLAVDYLSREERAELNILTVDERTQPTLPGVEESLVETRQGHDIPADPPSIESISSLIDVASTPTPRVLQSDAPLCMQCGVQMQRAGSCHACPSCGNTSGCS